MPSRYYKILLPILVFGAALILCLVVGYKTLHQPQTAIIAPTSTSTVAVASSSVQVPNIPPSSLKSLQNPAGPAVSVSVTPTTTASVSIPANYQHATLTIAGTTYNLAFPPDSTVEAAMKLLETQDPPFTFTEHEYPGLGEFVDSIAGKENAGGYYWFLYVNGVDSPTGVSDTTVHPGDTIEWKYEHQ